MKTTSISMTLLSLAMGFMPLLFSAHGGGGLGGGHSVGGGRGWGDVNSHYTDRHYVDPNYYYGGNAGGYVGGYGGYYGPVLPAYPPADSQPGMSDDSDALYQSYLKSNGG